MTPQKKKSNRFMQKAIFVAVLFAFIVSGSGLVGINAAIASEQLTPEQLEELKTPFETCWTITCFARAFVPFILDIFLKFLQQVQVFIAGALFFMVEWFEPVVDAPVVTIGWVIVRDVANLFFILILAIIAFGTIIGSQKVNYKEQLVRLLLMAVLINFSKTITGLLIDVSQVVMLTFGHAIANDQSAPDFLDNLGIGPIAGDLRPGATTDLLALIVNKVFGIITTVFGTIALGAMFVMLLWRQISLWILAVLSPLAFFLSAAPGGQKYSSRWWDELTKHLITGPILIFFLWLTIRIQGQMENYFSGRAIENINISGAELGTGSAMMTFVITLGLLMVGLKAATEAGGSAGATEWVSGFARNRGKDLGGFAERWVGRGGVGSLTRGLGFGYIQNKKGRSLADWFTDKSAFLAPTVVQKGWAARTARVERESFRTAEGRFEDLLNKRFNARLGYTGGAKTLAKILGKTRFSNSWLAKKAAGVTEGGKETFEERMAEEAAIAERQAEIEHANLPEEVKARMFLKAKGIVEVAALMRAMSNGNHQDGVVNVAHRLGIKGWSQNENGVYTSQDYKRGLKRKLEGEVGKERAKELLTDLDEYNESLSKIRDIGNGYTDAEGHAHLSDEMAATEDKNGINIETAKLNTKVNIDDEEFTITSEEKRVELLNKAQNSNIEKIRQQLKKTKEEIPDIAQGTYIKAGTELDLNDKTQRYLNAQNIKNAALFRMRRGNSEKWVSNIGAAEICRQNTDPTKLAQEGQYVMPSEVGEFLWNEMPQAFGATIMKTRLFQDRAIRDIGIAAAKYTSKEVADLGPDYAEAKGIAKIDWEKFFTQYILNPNTTAAFFSRVGYKEDQVDIIRGQYKEGKEQIFNKDGTPALDEDGKETFRKVMKVVEEGIAQKEWKKFVQKLEAKFEMPIDQLLTEEEMPKFYDLIHRTAG